MSPDRRSLYIESILDQWKVEVLTVLVELFHRASANSRLRVGFPDRYIPYNRQDPIYLR